MMALSRWLLINNQSVKFYKETENTFIVAAAADVEVKVAPFLKRCTYLTVHQGRLH